MIPNGSPKAPRGRDGRPNNPTPLPPAVHRLDLVWGADAVAAVINTSPRRAKHMLSMGYIPGARKVGARWCVSRRALERFLLGEEAAA